MFFLFIIIIIMIIIIIILIDTLAQETVALRLIAQVAWIKFHKAKASKISHLTSAINLNYSVFHM